MLSRRSSLADDHNPRREEGAAWLSSPLSPFVTAARFRSSGSASSRSRPAETRSVPSRRHSPSATDTSTPRPCIATRRTWGRRSGRAGSTATRSGSRRSSRTAIRAPQVRVGRSKRRWSGSAWTPSTSTSCTGRTSCDFESWRVLEQLHGEGLARSIGVSNFLVAPPRRAPPRRLRAPGGEPDRAESLSSTARGRTRFAAARRAGIALEAYSPLTKGRRLHDSTVASLADRGGADRPRRCSFAGRCRRASSSFRARRTRIASPRTPTASSTSVLGDGADGGAGTPSTRASRPAGTPRGKPELREPPLEEAALRVRVNELERAS